MPHAALNVSFCRRISVRNYKNGWIHFNEPCIAPKKMYSSIYYNKWHIMKTEVRYCMREAHTLHIEMREQVSKNQYMFDIRPSLIAYLLMLDFFFYFSRCDSQELVQETQFVFYTRTSFSRHESNVRSSSCCLTCLFERDRKKITRVKGGKYIIVKIASW